MGGFSDLVGLKETLIIHGTGVLADQFGVVGLVTLPVSWMIWERNQNIEQKPHVFFPSVGLNRL